MSGPPDPTSSSFFTSGTNAHGPRNIPLSRLEASAPGPQGPATPAKGLYDWQALDAALSPEAAQRLRESELTKLISLQLLNQFDREFNVPTIQIDGRVTKERPDSHRRVLSRLLLALWQPDPLEVLSLPNGSNPSELTAQSVVEVLCRQAVRNLVSDNVREPVYQLAFLPGERRQRVPMNERALEVGLSSLIVKLAIRCSEQREWALTAVQNAFDTERYSSHDGQVHVGPKTDLQLLGECCDLVERCPDREARVRRLLASFLPDRYVHIFVDEYRKISKPGANGAAG